MQRKMTIVWCALLALAAWPVLAQETYNDNATDKVAGREGVVGEKGDAPLGPQSRVNAGASVNAPAANANAGLAGQMGGNTANRWRYRYHNNHWWFYQPNNQWSYWNGNAWSGYNPQTYRQWYANRPGFSGGYYSGYRGNYNTFGNGMSGYSGYAYGPGMYGGNYGYGNNYGSSPGANLGGAIDGAIGGAQGANAGAAIGGAAGGYGRR